MTLEFKPGGEGLRTRAFHIIFESDTPLGQGLSVMVMLTGYSIIVVPTGVFSAQVIRSIREERYSDEACPGCGHDRHERGALYCLKCVTWLDEDTPDPHHSEDEQAAWWQARKRKEGKKG